MTSPTGDSVNADTDRPQISSRNENVDTGGGISTFVASDALHDDIGSPLLTLSPSTPEDAAAVHLAGASGAWEDVDASRGAGFVARAGEVPGDVNGGEDRGSGSVRDELSEDDRVCTEAFPDAAARSGRYKRAVKVCPRVVDPADPDFDPAAFDSCGNYLEAIDWWIDCLSKVGPPPSWNAWQRGATLIAKRWVDLDFVLLDVWTDLPSRKKFMSDLYDTAMPRAYGSDWRALGTQLRQVEQFEAASQAPLPGPRSTAASHLRRSGVTGVGERTSSGERVVRV